MDMTDNHIDLNDCESEIKGVRSDFDDYILFESNNRANKDVDFDSDLYEKAADIVRRNIDGETIEELIEQISPLK